jgi:hypothetical protein
LVFERHSALRSVGLLLLVLVFVAAVLGGPTQRERAVTFFAECPLLSAVFTLGYVLVVFAMVTNVEQLTIAVSQRTYVLRRGPWPFCRAITGPLDDLAGIVVGSNGGESPWGSHSWVEATVVWRDPDRRGFTLWREETSGVNAAKEAQLTQVLVARAAQLGARFGIPTLCENQEPSTGPENGS